MALVPGRIKHPEVWQHLGLFAELFVTATFGKKDSCSLATTWSSLALSHKDAPRIPKLISTCFRVATHVIAADVRCYIRWVPSERSPADRPSRKCIHKQVRAHRHPADQVSQVPVFALKTHARQHDRRRLNAPISSCRFATPSAASFRKPHFLACRRHVPWLRRPASVRLRAPTRQQYMMVLGHLLSWLKLVSRVFLQWARQSTPWVAKGPKRQVSGHVKWVV